MDALHRHDRSSFLPVFLLQDAVLAVEAGVQGIVLSNHGGRQLEVRLFPPKRVDFMPHLSW